MNHVVDDPSSIVRWTLINNSKPSRITGSYGRPTELVDPMRPPGVSWPTTTIHHDRFPPPALGHPRATTIITRKLPRTRSRISITSSMRFIIQPIPTNRTINLNLLNRVGEGDKDEKSVEIRILENQLGLIQEGFHWKWMTWRSIRSPGFLIGVKNLIDNIQWDLESIETSLGWHTYIHTITIINLQEMGILGWQIFLGIILVIVEGHRGWGDREVWLKQKLAAG